MTEPSFASQLVADIKVWNIQYSTSSPRNPRSNGKQNLQSRLLKEYLPVQSALEGHLAPLLLFRSTPVNSDLWSSAKMFYQCTLHITIPQWIKHKDLHATTKYERLEECTTQSAANHDHTGCCKKSLLHAGRTVSVINNDRTWYLPCHWSTCSWS